MAHQVASVRVKLSLKSCQPRLLTTLATNKFTPTVNQDTQSLHIYNVHSKEKKTNVSKIIY
jgi:hypothetical protein